MGLVAVATAATPALAWAQGSSDALPGCVHSARPEGGGVAQTQISMAVASTTCPLLLSGRPSVLLEGPGGVRPVSGTGTGTGTGWCR